MDVKFRNANLKLKKLETTKIMEIINDVTKQHEDKLKKHMNENQIKNFIREACAVCQSDINDKLYEKTLQVLMTQYETDCKPVIYDLVKKEVVETSRPKLETELRQQIAETCRGTFEAELRQQVLHECRGAFAQELRQHIEKECKPKFEAELKKRVETESKTKFEAELKKQVETESKAKFETELKQQIERELKPIVEAELKQKSDKNTPVKGTKNISRTSDIPQINNEMLKGMLTYKLTNSKK